MRKGRQQWEDKQKFLARGEPGSKKDMKYSSGAEK